MPPSIQVRPPISTASEIPGTAPLADTASDSGHPCAAANAREMPDSTPLATRRAADAMAPELGAAGGPGRRGPYLSLHRLLTSSVACVTPVATVRY